MDDRHAQSLQNQALQALSQLGAWIWQQHETLLPDDLSTVTREQAQRYSAYLEWYTTVETALRALEVAAPSLGEFGEFGEFGDEGLAGGAERRVGLPSFDDAESRGEAVAVAVAEAEAAPVAEPEVEV